MRKVQHRNWNCLILKIIIYIFFKLLKKNNNEMEAIRYGLGGRRR